MSKGNTTENDLIKFVFNNVSMPSYGSNLYLVLHSADPGEDGTADLYEISYTGYERVAVSRDSGGFTVNGSAASNTLLVQFGKCTGGSTTASHLSITNNGTKTTASQILYSGALTTSLNISNNITPQFSVGALSVTED
jgi:hypothetical protein